MRQTYFDLQGEGVMASYSERPGQLNSVVIETPTQTTQPKASDAESGDKATTEEKDETT